jgi:hypothetical protein
LVRGKSEQKLGDTERYVMTWKLLLLKYGRWPKRKREKIEIECQFLRTEHFRVEKFVGEISMKLLTAADTQLHESCLKSLLVWCRSWSVTSKQMKIFVLSDNVLPRAKMSELELTVATSSLCISSYRAFAALTGNLIRAENVEWKKHVEVGATTNFPTGESYR